MMYKTILSLSCCLYLCLTVAATQYNLVKTGSVTVNENSELAFRCFDDELTTAWNTNYANHAKGIITLQYPDAITFNAVQIYGKNIEKVTIEIKDAKDNWQTISPTESNHSHWRIGIYSDKEIKTRAIRLTLVGGEKSRPVTVKELSVYTTKTHNKALFKTIYAKGTGISPSSPPARVNDGLDETSMVPGPPWVGSEFIIDFGRPVDVSKLVVKERGLLTNIAVYVPTNDAEREQLFKDEKAWRKVAESKTEKGGVKRHVVSFDSVKTQYAKIAVQGDHKARPSEIEFY